MARELKNVQADVVAQGEPTPLAQLQEKLTLIEGGLRTIDAKILLALQLIDKSKRFDAQGLNWRPTMTLVQQALHEAHEALMEEQDAA